jgi:hemoglobin-like flavoprotein
MNFIKLFHDSYERAVTHEPDAFFTEFYRIFHAKSASIAQMFADTDMQMQRQALVASLMLMVWFSNERKSDEQMQQLAARHAELGIKLDLYDLWMDALIETLALVDPHHDDADALAWRIVLSPGITYMKHANTIDH